MLSLLHLGRNQSLPCPIYASFILVMLFLIPHPFNDLSLWFSRTVTRISIISVFSMAYGVLKNWCNRNHTPCHFVPEPCSGTSYGLRSGQFYSCICLTHYLLPILRLYESEILFQKCFQEDWLNETLLYQ